MRDVKDDTLGTPADVPVYCPPALRAGGRMQCTGTVNRCGHWRMRARADPQPPLGCTEQRVLIHTVRLQAVLRSLLRHVRAGAVACLRVRLLSLADPPGAASSGTPGLCCANFSPTPTDGHRGLDVTVIP